MNDGAILLRGVVKAFGSLRALDGVDLDVDRAEVFGFLGPNGAGKTTAIRILTGFIRAGAGEARVLGFDPWRQAVEAKRRVGFLPDLIDVGTGFTGRAFLDHMAKLRGYRGTPPMRASLLDRLELSAAALARRVKGYSTGMRKKLALVQAMQHDPDLLIMDEPTESLDPLTRQALFDLFREERERGVTIFMSSHVLSDVEDTCQRVALIRQGRIVRTGTVDDLRKGQSRTMVVEFRQPPADGFAIPGASVLSREGATLRLGVAGELNDVVRELARYDLLDLVYERLSLEELFMDYYHETVDGSRAPDG